MRSLHKPSLLYTELRRAPKHPVNELPPIGTSPPAVGPVENPLSIWGFPKIRGTLLGVPIVRIIVFRGLYWGSLILGNYHFIAHLLFR